jgi:hypothetical protein
MAVQPVGRLLPLGAFLVMFALVSAACSLSLVDLPGLFGPTATATPSIPLPPNPTPLPEAEVEFLARIPSDTPSGEQIFLSVLDEVTGLALNPQHFRLQAREVDLYVTRIRVPAGTVVKYRYTRQGEATLTATEHTTDGRQVRYRMVRVDGPGRVEDLISRWNDTQFSGPTGQIVGAVTAADSRRGLPNILVTAGGAQTLTSSDGSFLFEGLPPGTHNLVAYALDGAYRTYQQGAIVAAGATTLAPLALEPAPLVNVTFSVVVPEDTIPGVPVRIAGDLLQFGNSFAALEGGLSAPANRMPVLNFVSDTRYELTMALPAGAALQYKYTLGDGFWNAEHTPDGSFRLRRLIVPSQDHTVEDGVASWRAGNNEPIWFDVTVPADTPPGDVVAIQFNPFGWTEPIPMWSLGANRWVYRLTSPLDIFGTIGYRYCRNSQCASADDAVTPGDRSGGRPVSTSNQTQNLQDTVNRWQWWDPAPGPITVPAIEISQRPAGFVAGIELQSAFEPSWAPHYQAALRDIAGIRANWVIMAPGWSFTRLNPPVLELVPGSDPMWGELERMMVTAHDQGLKIGLRPVVRMPGETLDWWDAAPRDQAWWEAWFEGYRTFALHHADLAARQNAEALILGGEEVLPALPGGLLGEAPSGVPADAESRWRNLFQEVRRRYGGVLAWALPYPQGVENPPPFLDAVDQIHLLWTAPLLTGEQASAQGLEAGLARVLDSEVLLLQVEADLPLVIDVAVPSAAGAISGCLPGAQTGCLDIEALSQPNPDRSEIQLRLEEQVEAYNALLLAIDGRSWISGIVARGYYPPAALRDKSISVHGKPAADLLSYWFPRMRGLEP